MPPHLSRCYEQKQTVQWLYDPRLARPATAQQQHGGLYDRLLFYYIFIFNDFRQTISRSTGPNFAEFPGLAELWL